MKFGSIFSKMNVKMGIFFFVISLILTLSISYSSYYIASSIILNNMKEQTRDSIDQASEYISEYLDKIKGLSDLIAMYPDTIAALERSDEKSIQSLASMLKISASSDKRLQSVSVISKNGFAVTSDSSMAMPLSDNMMDESWYKNAVLSKRMPAVTSIRHGEFTMDKSSWVISISHEIVDEKNRHLGVVLIDMSYRFIEDYIKSLNLGKNGYAYILDSDNMIIYHRDENVLMDEMKADELRMLSKLSNQSEISDNFEYIITKDEIANSDWLLVGISSMENVHELKNSLIKTLVLINFVILMASIFISFAISGKFTDPITQLQNAMMKLDENWGHLQISPHSSIEIKELAREYNELIDRIKLLTRDIAQKEDAKRIFELKALQSQINPHFLYNTLDTILWLAELGENEKVADVSKALGQMLRFSLNINQNMVELEHEMKHIENYLKIQNYRYDDRIHYEITGDEKLLHAKVPKMILQPIIENAIYHGIRKKSGSGTIFIEFEAQGEDLILCVSDDGIGYCEEAQKSDNESGLKAKLGGIGLGNVDQRIKILCGEEYGISIRAREGGGTIVSYRLKYI